MQDPSAFAAVLQQQQQQLNPSQFPEQEQLRCPRCDSTNTKFCYYNNYNLSQPRHFCKSCRRYWTKGGTLRNVPVGGGSRKSSAKRSSSAASSAAKRYSSSRSPAGPSGQDQVPKPEALGPIGFPVGGFTSLLASTGQFGSMLQGMGRGPGLGFSPGIGPGLGSLEEGVLGESGGGCWGNSSGSNNNGWPDLAIFTPSSRLR